MKSRNAWVVGGTLAALGGGATAVVGFVFTGWLLVRPSCPTVGDYAGFLVASAFLAAIGALPGLVVGFALSRRKGSE
jgi:hypothetical protein